MRSQKRHLMKVVTTRLTAEELADLDAAAGRNGLTRSAYIRSVLLDSLVVKVAPSRRHRYGRAMDTDENVPSRICPNCLQEFPRGDGYAGHDCPGRPPRRTEAGEGTATTSATPPEPK